MDLLQRLKERKLVRWTAAYLAAAWVVLEVVTTFQEGLGLSGRLFPIMVAILGVGLLITVVIAWYHGKQGRQRVSAPEVAILAVLLAGAGWLGVSFVSAFEDVNSVAEGEAADAERSETALRSIAVLPFENRSGLPEDQPFVDGIHDEVMGQLRKIHSLELKSLTSVMEYRDSPKSAPVIGQELRARYLVEGSVQRVENTVRMRVRLVEAETDASIWDQTYDEDLTVSNLLDIQRSVALEVASQLGAEVIPVERARLAVTAPDDLEAYQSYLDGVYHLRSIMLGANAAGESIPAIEALSAAIDLAPDWAPPRTVLGAVYHWRASSGGQEEDYGRSLAALEQALRLDSLSAPAWSSLGFVRHRYLRDFVGAEEALARASALGSSQAGWVSAILYRSWGRYDEAIRQYETAIEQNPLSPFPRLGLGLAHVCRGAYDLGAETIRAAIEETGRDSDPMLAYAYYKAGREDEARIQLERLRQQPLSGVVPWLLALDGQTEEAARLLDELDARSPLLNGDMARVAAAVVLEQEDRALRYLERSAETDPGSIMFMQCNPEVRSLAGNPRYQQVLDVVGFPAAQQ